MTGNWYDPFPVLFIHGPLCAWSQEYPGVITGRQALHVTPQPPTVHLEIPF